MIDWGTVIAVVVGGGLALLGTLLAHHLQHARERAEQRRERVRERLQPVRTFVDNTLHLADWVCSADGTTGWGMDPENYDWWLEQWSRLVGRFRSTDLSWSVLVVAADDEKLGDLLAQIRDLGGRLGWRSESVDLEGMLEDEAFSERDELVTLAARAYHRIEELIDEG